MALLEYHSKAVRVAVAPIKSWWYAKKAAHKETISSNVVIVITLVYFFSFCSVTRIFLDNLMLSASHFCL